MTQLRRSLLTTLVGDEEIELLLSDQEQLRAMLAFEAALAGAEADEDLIPASAVAPIVEATSRFAPDWQHLHAGMARDGVVVPALVEQLRHAVGAPNGEFLHWGATSQDTVDTALVLQLSRIIPILLGRLTDLTAVLTKISAAQGSRTLMAYTRMQQALPFMVSDKLKTWIDPLERHAPALSVSRTQLLVVQLGGPIGNRSSFGGKGDGVARGLAKRLDLGIAEPWQTTRDPLVAFGSLLSLMTGSLGKMGADIALLAQNAIGAVKISAAGTSSAMPHKANPVKAEVLVTLARFNTGLLGTLHQTMVHENDRSGSAWTLEWMTLPAMLVATGASLRLARQLADDIAFQ